MSDDITTAEAPEMGTDSSEQPDVVNFEQYPADHPLVKTLLAQKSQLRDYKDLRAKAARFDEIEEAQKSEAERTADRIAKADAEMAAVPSRVSDALKAHLVAMHEISDEDSELFLTATDPETLLKQVTRLVGQTSKQRRTNTVPREGSTPETSSSDEAAFARELFSS